MHQLANNRQPTQGVLHVFTNHRTTRNNRNNRNLYRKSILIAAATAVFVGVAAPHASAQLTKTVGHSSRLADPGRLFTQPVRVLTTYGESQGCGFKSVGSSEIVFREKGTPRPTAMFSGVLIEANLAHCTSSVFGFPQSNVVSDSIMQLDMSGPHNWTYTTQLQREVNTIHFGYSSESAGDYVARITMWSASNPSIGATTTFSIRLD
jgi:hypothetical protein